MIAALCMCVAIDKLLRAQQQVHKSVTASDITTAADTAQAEQKVNVAAAASVSADAVRKNQHLPRTHTVPPGAQSSVSISRVESDQLAHTVDVGGIHSRQHPPAVAPFSVRAHEKSNVRQRKVAASKVRASQGMEDLDGEQHNRQQQPQAEIRPKSEPKSKRLGRAAPIHCTWNMVIALLVVVIAIVAIVVLVVLLSGSSNSASDTDHAALLGSLAIGLVTSTLHHPMRCYANLIFVMVYDSF